MALRADTDTHTNKNDFKKPGAHGQGFKTVDISYTD